MQFQALSAFIIVKVEKEVQVDSREKDGYFYTHSDHVFMQRERQYGEIISLGKEAQDIFPEAKVGHTLIFHHFVSGKDVEDKGNNRNHLYTDERFNYYAVTIKSYYGDRNMSYGIWDGEKIMPHPEYIFLQPQVLEPEQEIASNGLTVIHKEDTREEIGKKMKEIKSEIGELTKTHVSADLTTEIQNKEREMNKLSKITNKKELALYPVSYVSDKVKSFFTMPFTFAGMVNVACNTSILFNDTNFIVAPIKYLKFVK